MKYCDTKLSKKLYKPFSNHTDNVSYFSFLKRALWEDKKIFVTLVIYGIVISILSLSVPVSVQLLVNFVSFTALLQPILVLGFILFLLVSIYGIVNLLQFYVTEIFQRRFFARMGYEAGMSLLDAKHEAFESANQVELVNRFFETVSIQKAIPKLFSKTFTVFLQSFVGLFLIACYHPFFLVFSLGIPLLVWLIWKLFSANAIKHSYLKSRRKYDLVGWLEDVAGNNLLFKSLSGREYAKFKIDFLTGLYLKERKSYFKNLFSQVVLLYLLYAVATTLLLILGGWLVLKGQLTLGQLVASELVISVVLYNVSVLGRDFGVIYELIASAEKISHFQNIPKEEASGEVLPGKIEEIIFDRVAYLYHGSEYLFNLKFVSGRSYIIFTNGYSTRKIMTEMLLALRSPAQGRALFNGMDIENLNKYELRSRIAVIDNSPLIEGTLREYLTFNRTNIPDHRLEMMLEKFGLQDLVFASEDRLDLRIIPNGWPFSESEQIILKVLRAVIQNPEIIIADHTLDMLEPNLRKKILTYLMEEQEASFLYFSHCYEDADAFDHRLFVEKKFSHEIDNMNEFRGLYEKK